jgi:hypothetical protein
MGKNKKFLAHKTEEVIMKEGKQNQLEVILKKMLNHFDEDKAKQKQQIPQPGTGNIIRRRKGEKDTRFPSA